jgi:hypothetical protein
MELSRKFNINRRGTSFKLIIMSTKGLTLVKYNGEYKIAQYGLWDHYPEGQGFKVVSFLNKPDLDLDRFKKQLDMLTYYNDMSFSEYNREIGADILDLIYTESMTQVFKDISFAGDSLFCEWAWCVNLDTNCLDCFKGLNKEKLSDEQPFRFLQKDYNKYHPIKLFDSIPFNQVSKFLTQYDFKNYIDIKLITDEILSNNIPTNWENKI